MAEDRYDNVHGLEIAQLCVHVDDLGQRRDAKAGGTFDGICTPVENTPWESPATQQVLHEIETLKMGVNIDSRHVLILAGTRSSC
jgi:hypothetical protein